MATFCIMQKLSFEDVLQNRCSKKCRKFRRKSLVLGSLLIRLRAHRPANLLKRDSNIGDFLQHRCFSCEICETFKNTFKRTPSVTASDHGNDDRKSVNSYSRKSYDKLWQFMTNYDNYDNLWQIMIFCNVQTWLSKHSKLINRVIEI